MNQDRIREIKTEICSLIEDRRKISRIEVDGLSREEQGGSSHNRERVRQLTKELIGLRATL